MQNILRFRSAEEIKESAYEFLNQVNTDKSIPVEIDLIADRLGIDIIPEPYLQEKYDIDAFITSDFSEIYIDQHVYFNVEVRYRFSVAHEMGHMVLHKDFYRQYTFSNFNEWRKVYNLIDGKLYSRAEWQSNMFAGHILIPEYHFKEKFINVLDNQEILSRIQEAKDNGFTKDKYIRFVIPDLAVKLSPIYNVSTECMEKRIYNDDTYINLIP